MSQASTTQLYNPITHTWSDRLLSALGLPPKLFPPLVPAGTELGPLRPEIAKTTGLEDAQVVASCSHETAAALVGLPISPGESWAFLRLGSWTVMGTELAEPIITDASRALNFTNEVGYRRVQSGFPSRPSGCGFSKSAAASGRKRTARLMMVCSRTWRAPRRPFESLINPTDPRFLEPGDMPLKIQAFCRETHQRVPRKPGPIIRCVMESLALQYRKTLQEIEELTGRQIARLYLLGGSANALLNHFTANALRRPLVVGPADAAAIGNVIVQALALGHLKSTRTGAGSRAQFLQDGNPDPIRHRLGYGLRSAHAPLSCLALQLPLQNLTGQRRVRLAFAELHHLAFQEVQGGGFAGLVIRRRAGVGGDGLIAELLDCARIADLGEALLLDDSARALRRWRTSRRTPPARSGC